MSPDGQYATIAADLFERIVASVQEAMAVADHGGDYMWDTLRWEVRDGQYDVAGTIREYGPMTLPFAEDALHALTSCERQLLWIWLAPGVGELYSARFEMVEALARPVADHVLLILNHESYSATR